MSQNNREASLNLVDFILQERPKDDLMAAVYWHGRWANQNALGLHHPIIQFLVICLTLQINTCDVSDQAAGRIGTQLFHNKTTNDYFTSKTKHKRKLIQCRVENSYAIALFYCNSNVQLERSDSFLCGVLTPGGVLPYLSYIGMCRPKGMVFEPFWTENGYRFRPLWS